MRLTSAHLATILNEIWSARNEWYNIGLGLGIYPADLEVVKEKNHGDPNSCFREILTNWLNRQEPVPTLSAIINALESKTVGLGHLASEVRKLSVNVSSGSQSSTINSNAEACIVHKSKNPSIESGTIEFFCPCGNCSLKSYINNGCPLTTSMAFPYLNLTRLLSSQKEKENLIQRLSNDIDEIKCKFAELLDEVCDSLDKQITTKQLARRVINRSIARISEDHEEKLRQSECIDDSFIILRKYMSFFNFGLLESIIEWNKCPKENQVHLEKYREKLNEFCLRKVFEVPQNVYSDMDVSITAQRKFVVLSTKDMAETSLNDVLKMRIQLANILDCDVGDLHLHIVDQGCLLLVFSIPNTLAERLFPLDVDLVEKLKSQGFTVFTTTGIHV